MILHTDFEDYYDATLARRDAPVTLWRQRHGLFDRRLGLQVATRAGWRTVPHGTLEELVQQSNNAPKKAQEMALLVFYDNYTSNGLMPCSSDPTGLCDPLSPVGMMQAREPGSGCDPDEWATFYLPQFTEDMRAFTFSHVAVGHRQFSVVTQNLDPLFQRAWASNRGRYVSTVQGEVTGQYGGRANSAIPYPLWSMDYVLAPAFPNGPIIPVAFELNVAPVLHDLGLRVVMSDEEVAEAISTRAVELAQATEESDGGA